MTGTSLDGLDAALVEISGHDYAISAQFIRGITASLGRIGGGLKRMASGEAMTAAEISFLMREFALLHTAAVRELLKGETADLIAIHGQTVYHKPPLSWQLFNPSVPAMETGITVVSDFRSLDIAAGGQGAPITPLADFVFFRSEEARRTVVNLGGFINVTFLPAGREIPAGEKELERLPRWVNAIRGRDVCACNQLLDAAARIVLNERFDRDGGAGLTGAVDSPALESLVRILQSQAGSKRSLGSGDEGIEWIERFRGGIPPNDLLRTACAGVATSLSETLGTLPGEVIVAGGGAANRALMVEISGRLGTEPKKSGEFVLPGEYREAAGMAALGALAQDGTPITLPAITGAGKGCGPGAWTIP